MTRDDIIRMAIEAGLPEYTGRLEVFAALVISHHVKETRPEVSDSMATWLQQIAYQHGGIGDLSRTEMEFGAMVAAAEREACASILDRNVAVCGTDSVMGDVLASNALAIRARGEQE